MVEKKKSGEEKEKTYLALCARIADRTNALKLADHIDAFASVATRRTGALVNVSLAVSAYKDRGNGMQIAGEFSSGKLVWRVCRTAIVNNIHQTSG